MAGTFDLGFLPEIGQVVDLPFHTCVGRPEQDGEDFIVTVGESMNIGEFPCEVVRVEDGEDGAKVVILRPVLTERPFAVLRRCIYKAR